MFGKKLFLLLIFASFFINVTSPIAQSVKLESVKLRRQSVPPNGGLSTAWNSGTLPLPMTLPPGNTDEVAATLAKQVASKGTDTMPAMIKALQLAGFFITDRTGKVVFTPDNKRGQGLLIEGWEIAAAAKMLGEGRMIELAEVSKQLRLIRPLKDIDVGEYLLDGIRKNAENTTNPYLRIWARFIIELGKNSDEKYDMSMPAESKKVMLDPVQHLLIMRRLYGDFFALAQKHKEPAGAITPPVRTGGPSAGWDGDIFQQEILQQVSGGVISRASDAANPCKLEGDAPTVMDAGATIMGYGFGKLTEYLEGKGSELIGKYAEFVGVANIILAYAKFLQTYASLETKISASPGGPLIRTKNSVPGGRKTIQAQLTMNLGNWPMYNCLRLLITLKTGIDFATLNNGPLPGVGLTWVLDEGGAQDVYNNRDGMTGAQQIVGFTQDGRRIQDKGSSAKNVGSGTYTKTDDNGMASIILEGTPQRNAKIGAVMPIMKNAHVRTVVRMKAGDIKGDAVDAVGQALGGLPGLATFPIELLYRTDWISIADIDIPVKDWEECKGPGWHGAIEYKRVIEQSSSESLSYQKSSSSHTSTYTATIQARPNIEANKHDIDKMGTFDKTDGKIHGGVLMAGSAVASFEEKSQSSSVSHKEDFCRFTAAGGKDKRSETCTSNSSGTRIGGGEGDGDVTLGFLNNTYSIDFFLPKVMLKGQSANTRKCVGGCGPAPSVDTSRNFEEEYEQGGVIVRAQPMDPENPDAVEGQVVDENGNTTETITWAFSRCG